MSRTRSGQPAQALSGGVGGITLGEMLGLSRPPLPPNPFEQQQPAAPDGFENWYQTMARRHDLAPDPDAPEQFYDYRAAYRAGAQPDQTGHWPSTFKQPGHPNMVVGGFNVQTGERVPGTPRAGYEELVRLGWDRQTAAQLARTPEPQRRQR